jgi:hypothetical protein
MLLARYRRLPTVWCSSHGSSEIYCCRTLLIDSQTSRTAGGDFLPVRSRHEHPSRARRNPKVFALTRVHMSQGATAGEDSDRLRHAVVDLRPQLSLARGSICNPIGRTTRGDTCDNRQKKWQHCKASVAREERTHEILLVKDGTYSVPDLAGSHSRAIPATRNLQHKRRRGMGQSTWRKLRALPDVGRPA